MSHILLLSGAKEIAIKVYPDADPIGRFKVLMFSLTRVLHAPG